MLTLTSGMTLMLFAVPVCWHFIAFTIAIGYAGAENNAIVNEISNGAASTYLHRYDNGRCSVRKYEALVNSIDDVEDLKLDVPIHIAFESEQEKRFLLYINSPSPLTMTFSQNVVRKIYFNQTTNLSRSLKPTYQNQRFVLLPCALSGQYDIFVTARQRGSILIEAHGKHPEEGYWPLMNFTNRVRLRTQNRIGKGQMIVKWHKSKTDFHAVRYCLVVSTQQSHHNFCQAVHEYVTTVASTQRKNKATCYPSSFMDIIWSRSAERTRKIDLKSTNVICTGSRTRQQLNGLAGNCTYYLDLFGIHTKRQNLTFHLGSKVAQFIRTHPLRLRANVLSVEKISGLHGIRVFSFKVPSSPTTRSLDYSTPTNTVNLRYLILPCEGSEVDAKILKKRQVLNTQKGIYAPTYIPVPHVHIGERYMMRFSPSNEDEVLRANKVGLAVTTRNMFSHLAELPTNISVFEIRTDCQSSKIAWYSSPDVRTMHYCIIVFSLPQRNRSAADYTNYCLDFGKGIKQYPQFYSTVCKDRTKSQSNIEVHTIENLSPGENYLVYVTVSLNAGRPLPYQSLGIRTSHHCYNDSREQNAYY